MKRTIKTTVVMAALLTITAAAWAQSNGDSYIPNEVTTSSKGVNPCYKELTEWAAAQAKGDGTAPAPPAWVTERCAPKNEPPAKPFPGINADEFWSNN